MKRISVTPVVGLPQARGWSQVSENLPSYANRVVVAFAIEGEQASNIGRDFATEITQFNPQTPEEAYRLFLDLTSRFKAKETRVFLSAGVFFRHQSLYLVMGGSVLLKREGRVGVILSSSHGRELKLITGKHDIEDVLVFATAQASEFFSEIEIKFETGFDTDTIIASIVPGVHSRRESDLSAIAFVLSSEYELNDNEDDQLLRTKTTDYEADHRGYISDQSEDDQEANRRSDQRNNKEESILEISIESIDDKNGEDKNHNSGPTFNPNSDSASTFTSNSHPNGGSEELVPSVNLDELPSYDLSAANELGLTEEPPPESLTHPRVLLLTKFFIKLLKIIWDLIKSLLSSLPIKLRKLDLSKFSNNKRYLKQGLSVKTKRIILLFVAALLILTSAIYWHFHTIGRDRLDARAQLLPYEEILDKAQQLLDSDPVAARDEVSKTIRELEAVRNQYQDDGKAIYVQEFNIKIEQAQNLFKEISGKKELAELPIYYDLREIKSDFVVSKSSIHSDTAAFVDIDTKQLVILNLASKEPKLVDLSKIGKVKDIKVREKDIVILADGLYSVSKDGGEPKQIIVEGDSNRDGTLLGVYEHYIYVFNPSKRNIFRYSGGADNSFSEPIGWLQATKGLVYEEIDDWAIDGDIWLAASTGELKKLTSGREEEFAINGLPDGFSSSLFLATGADLENLYILEPSSSRLVILNKNGDFLKEIKSISLAAVNQILVDAQTQRVFTVSGSIVFEIDI